MFKKASFLVLFTVCLSCFGLVSCSDDDSGLDAKAICEHRLSCMDLEDYGTTEEEAMNYCVKDVEEAIQESKQIGCGSEYEDVMSCINKASCSELENIDEENGSICVKEADAYMGCLKSKLPEDAWEDFD